ncbi:MAG: glycosyltransferase [Acidobacteria bacterium]|nr:glycosyltransferase [Acidobacteriota bacterium]
MLLTVLSVAFPFAGVGPDAVGGAEQVLAQVDAGLVAAGHRSIVLAAEGSHTAGELIAVPRLPGTLTAERCRLGQVRQREALQAALARTRVDVVHMHGIDFAEYLPDPGVPVVATLHLPPGWYPEDALRPSRPATWLVCVSEAQRDACPPSSAVIETIENGVDARRFAPRVSKRSFALALGRICPEKGFEFALEAARLAGVPCLLGGAVFPFEEHQRYFEREIAPRLDRSRRFLGPLGWARKLRLLAAARCLLVPSLAPETSSLVAMEALAAGTPVIAYRRAGALAEIVEHGRTGFLVDSYQEMAAAIAAAPSIAADECRRSAEERFPAARTVARYIELYHALAGGADASA